jgi:hypothetical protein
MTEYLKWMEQHFELFFALCLLWVLAFVAFRAWRRLRAGPTHPPFSGSDVRFSEKYVSGSSDKSLFTCLGGARNALAVTVLKDALLVEPVGIFKWLMPTGFNDLSTTSRGRISCVSRLHQRWVETWCVSRFGEETERRAHWISQYEGTMSSFLHSDHERLLSNKLLHATCEDAHA